MIMILLLSLFYVFFLNIVGFTSERLSRRTRIFIIFDFILLLTYFIIPIRNRHTRLFM